ncbi:MAG: ABC transporter substrate-binding protein [Acidisphaera sp.]|nr:ABC transporter substrate-binding protein [Acidisphaera sp.]
MKNAKDSRRRFVTRLAVAMLAAVLATGARAAELTIGMAAAPTAIDPHYHLLATNMSIDAHMFETLVSQDRDLHPSPGLAVSWHLVDPLTWEFALRPGVKFQDGSEFTAEDAVFSIKRVALVPNSPSSYVVYTRSIAGFDIVDPHTLRIHTTSPTPDLPLDLSLIFIMSSHAAAGPVPEGKTTAQLNAGDGLVGTGPYRFVSYTPGDRVVLARNDGYWGGKQPWERVSIVFMTDGGARVAAALSGAADVVEKVPGDDIATVKANPKLSLVVTASNSVTYVALDEGRDSSPGVTGTDGRNPLKDERVRQALSLAIDREAIAQRIMAGLATPTGELVGVGMFGATPGLQSDRYDPAEAKRLLEAAGWGNGFGLQLATTSGAYVQDSQTGQAIASMWTRIGVRTTVDATPAAMFYAHRNAHGLSAFVTSSSIMTGQASDLLNIYVATPDKAKGLGTVNYIGYSSPAVDALLAQASQEMDPPKRAALLQQATHVALTGDHAMLPVFIEKLAYAVRRPLVFTPSVNKWITAMQVREPAPGTTN